MPIYVRLGTPALKLIAEKFYARTFAGNFGRSRSLEIRRRLPLHYLNLHNCVLAARLREVLVAACAPCLPGFVHHRAWRSSDTAVLFSYANSTEQNLFSAQERISARMLPLCS